LSGDADGQLEKRSDTAPSAPAINDVARSKPLWGQFGAQGATWRRGGNNDTDPVDFGGECGRYRTSWWPTGRATSPALKLDFGDDDAWHSLSDAPPDAPVSKNPRAMPTGLRDLGAGAGFELNLTSILKFTA
jgi:hypothetical protein